MSSALSIEVTIFESLLFQESKRRDATFESTRRRVDFEPSVVGLAPFLNESNLLVLSFSTSFSASRAARFSVLVFISFGYCHRGYIASLRIASHRMNSVRFGQGLSVTARGLKKPYRIIALVKVYRPPVDGAVCWETALIASNVRVYCAPSI